MRYIAASLLILVALDTRTAISAAQTTVDSLGKEHGRDAQRDPSSASILHGAQPMFSLVAGTSATEATASAGLNLSPQSDADNTLTLKLTGPVAKSGDTTDLVDLTGLVGTSRADVAYGFYKWNEHVTDPDQEFAICDREGFKSGCSASQLKAATDLTDWKNTVSMSGTWLFNADYTYSREQFSFRNATTLKSGETSESPLALTIGAGRYVSNAGILNATLSYEQSFKAGGSTQLCTALPVAGSQRCDNAVLGGPTVSDAEIGSIEYRYTHSATFAVSPTVEYDFRAKVAAFVLPLWMIHDANGGLAGGVRVGYRTDQHTITMVGFVGDQGK